MWPPDSPLVPRGWTPSCSHLSWSALIPFLCHPGKVTWTDARIPVPRLVGQEWMYPYRSSNMNFFCEALNMHSSTALIPRARRSKTPFTSFPCCIDMIRSWSSSLTQTRKVLSLLWKIPRPSGQSRSIPATMRLRSPDMKRKWSSTSCCRVASSIPVNG